MQIRGVDQSDAAALSTLLFQLGYEVSPEEVSGRIDAVLRVEGHDVWLAQIVRMPVGMIHIFERPAIEIETMLVVQSLVVAETHRRLGVGRALMAAVDQHAKQRQISSITLSSRQNRAGAHKFYQSLGFEISSVSATLTKKLPID